jgi:manganese/zinc/iron transport system ATP- binding protein
MKFRRHSPTATDSAEIPAIEVEDLTLAYREVPVLWDVDLSIPQGVLAAIVGPNGAGKSTLLKAILGLARPAAGTLKVLGKPLSEQVHKVAYVPQRSSVDWDFPATVLDAVLMGRYGAMGWFRRPSRSDRQKALDALEQVNMAEFASRHISQLSGGQQQRVFLARALVQESAVYLMDEPFQGVDASTEAEILTLLKSLRNSGKSIIVVHHDLQTVSDVFDWVVLLNVRVVASGPIDEAFTPSNIQTTYRQRTPLSTLFAAASRDSDSPQDPAQGA